MPLCKWHTFWMVLCLIWFFLVILFYIQRKWLLVRNLAAVLPLKCKLSGKFQRFNAMDRNIEMLNRIVEFSKISIKMKNCKTFCKAQIAIRFMEIIQPPPSHPHQIKIYYISGTKIFLGRYIEIYKHLLSKCFKNAVLARQEMVQCKYFFWHHKHEHVCWKICKVRKVFGCVVGAYYFQCQASWSS